VTIPAEKEIVEAVVHASDVDLILDQIIVAGKLGQPGKGFVFTYPVQKGLINSKTVQGGGAGQAASFEQVVASMDYLRSGTQWRRRASGIGLMGKRNFMSGINIEILCNEGYIHELVHAAMRAGAGGATLAKSKLFDWNLQHGENATPSRESAQMIVPETLIPKLIEELDLVSAFDEKTHGMVIAFPAPKALTFTSL
jgi:hypothetical protein